MSDAFEDRDEELGMVYEDPDEMHRMETLKRIHDARQRFDTGRFRATVGDEDEVEIAALLALDLVRAIEPLARRTDTDLLDREVSIGGEKHTISHLLDTGGVVERTEVIEKTDSDTGATYTEKESYHTTMSKPTSTRIVRLCDDFLQDVMPAGLLPDDDEETGFDAEMIKL